LPRISKYTGWDVTLSLGRKWESSKCHIDPFSKIIGTDPKIAKARNVAKRVARGDSSVILYGETGTGKEIFAEAIHRASSRAKGPFIPVNCAAIPESLMESELFGYEAGSFTGALRTGKLGKFEAADSGTIFLDEICDMSPLLQAKLLRTIQERTVERIGSSTHIPIDVRFITATNKNLEQMVADGLFREDLYYRLNVIRLELPPLRERLSDIELLSEFFLPKLNARCNTSATGIHPDVISVLHNYHWPGNVRELQNALEHALNFTDGNEIRTEHLPTRILYATWTSEHQDPKNAEDAFSLNNALISAEHQTLVNALAKCRNNRTEAAKLLGISRSTLYEKLKKHRVACERPAVKSQSPSQHPNERRHGLRRDEPRT
jgi:transcriptional regulator with PAS, ATPase and Fis domain